MMKKWLGKVAAVAALCLSANSFAGLIVDTVNQNELLNTSALDALTLNFDSYSYLHDLTDNGFSLGSAIGGSLEIKIWDDQDSRFSLPEVVLFTIEAFDFDTGGFTFGNDFSNSLEVEALAALNADGFLNVTVTSLLGDFYVGDSTLTVITRDVPEPGSLALLGLGLLGLGLARRNIKSA